MNKHLRRQVESPCMLIGSEAPKGMFLMKVVAERARHIDRSGVASELHT
jgi:hypothetical protein